MPAVSLDSSFTIAADVVFRELDGEAVLLNVASGLYFGLNRVGTRIWQLIDERRTLSTVVAAMSREYDASADVLERDVLHLASELVRTGLLVARDAASAS